MLSQSSPTQPSYVDLQKAPSVSDIEYVTRRCNEIIQNGSSNVKIEIKLQSDNEVPGTLPEDYRNGVIRYVIIDEIDKNPCCGTHNPSISSLGLVYIFPGITNISGPTRYRIFFAVGTAILHHLSRIHSIVKDTGTLLDCGSGDVINRVGTLLRSKKESGRREKNLKSDAVRALGRDLRESERVGESGVRTFYLHREDAETDVEFMNQIVTAAGLPPSNADADDQPYLIVLSSGPLNPSPGSNSNSGGCVLIIGSPTYVTHLTTSIKSSNMLNGRVRGGGKGGRWQGKVVGCWKESEVRELRVLVEGVGVGSGA